MKAIWNSFIIALSMYSKIPMPKTNWAKENMRYVMCFFPLIGSIIGIVVYLWHQLSQQIPMSRVFNTIIMILIPMVITGGIHMDGLLDTADALSSYQSKEKKIEILKDPNTGAFAVIICIGYYFITYGIWYDITPGAVPILAIGFVLSRAFSGLAVVTFPLAKNSGLAAMFSNQAKRTLTRRVMMLYILICMVMMLLLNWKLGLIGMISAMMVFIYYRHMAVQQFGGITGDLAGYFLQMCELVMAICVIMGDRIWF